MHPSLNSIANPNGNRGKNKGSDSDSSKSHKHKLTPKVINVSRDFTSLIQGTKRLRQSPRRILETAVRETNQEKVASPRETFEQSNINNHSVVGQDYHSAAMGYKAEGRSVSASRNQLEGKVNVGNKQKIVNTKAIYPHPRNHIIKHPTASNGKAISLRANVKMSKK